MPTRFGAIAMLVRTAWRRHWRASLFLALIAGLAASVIGASFQAATRSETSLERFTQRSRTFDRSVLGCPPGVDPKQVGNDFEALLRLCTNPPVATRFQKVVNDVHGVEQTAVGSTLVAALLDPTVSNKWGRVTLVEAFDTGAKLPPGRPIIVEGRFFDPNAPDEIVVSETAAKAGGIHAGDIVRMAGWRQRDLDTAIDGTLPPQTPSFASKVVGVVRFLEDVQAYNVGSLSDATIPGNTNIYAGSAWAAAHRADLSGYGTGVLVRVHDPSAAKAFETAMSKAPGGWFNQVDNVGDVDPSAINRVIELERKAILVFAFIAIVAALVFVGLSAIRQLRRESAEYQPLNSLGMTTRDLRLLNVTRALTIAVPACLVAVAGIIALSPFGPLGLARQLEYDTSVRVDAGVLAATVGALLVLFALAGALTRIDSQASRRVHTRVRPLRIDAALRAMGPVPVVGATVARGRSSRAAIAVTAIAVAAGIAAGSIVASFDRLVTEPRRYGATWDVVVGQYSSPDAAADGVAKLRANPAVAAAAGYLEQDHLARVDGRRTNFLAFTDFVGHHTPVISSGRAPATDEEAALGRDTARLLHKHVGDRITVLSNADKTVKLRVVGIVVVNDPVSSQIGAGSGAFVRTSVFSRLGGPGSTTPQSIVINVDPSRDRAAAIESVRRDFPGSIREATAPHDVLNLGKLRAVPWLIAALIAILALATLVHALVTMLARNRTNLAVLSAMGFVRRQRRGVGVFASVALVLTGIVIGIPVGLVLGARVWRAVSDGIDLPSTAVFPWAALLVASISALGIAALVAVVASWRSVRMTPSEQLRVE